MFEEIVKKQKEYFSTNETLNISFRKEMLKKLKNIITDNSALIEKALYQDLHKSQTESIMTEISLVIGEINYAIKNLKKWTKVKRVKTSIANFISKSYIINEPYGNVLIISPWNYPFLLAIEPLVSAIAAGNTAIIKPSEYSKNTSRIIEKIINDNFDEKYIHVLLGEVKETTELLKERFDLIFFTGSPKVGKIIMEAASKHLTKTILELGGKSPVVVDDTVSLPLASKRITFGKFLNSGQTCVSPDFLLVKENIKDELLKHLIKNAKEIDECSEYCEMINETAVKRILNLVDKEKIVYQGQILNKRIGPIILDNVSLDDLVMQEEIFGPILPIITYQTESEAIAILKEIEKTNCYPLAFYIFSNNQKFINELLKFRFGGGCINDTINHLASNTLPFGGIGNSGMGNYHGIYGFKAFSHEKSILKKSNLIDIKLRYYPYTKKKTTMIKKFLSR